MKNNSEIKNKIVFFVKLLFSFSVLFLLFTKISLGEVWDNLRQVNYFYFTFGSLFFVFCWLINSCKWKLLLHHIGYEVGLVKLFNLNLVSIFYASIVPGGQMAGEAIKCYKIAKESSNKTPLVFSVIMDRLTGLIAIIFIGFFSIILSQSLFPQIDKIKIIFAILSLLTVFALIFYWSKFLLRMRSIISDRSTMASSAVVKMIEAFVAYRGAYRLWLNVLLIACVFQFLSTFSVYLISLSLGLDVSLLDYLWVNSLVSLVLIIPLSLMGLGLREVSIVYLLQLLNTDSASALSLSLLLTLIYFSVGFIGGLIELFGFFRTNRQSHEGV